MLFAHTSNVVKLREKLTSLCEERQRLASEACQIDNAGHADLVQAEIFKVIEYRATLGSKIIKLDAQIRSCQMKLQKFDGDFAT